MQIKIFDKTNLMIDSKEYEDFQGYINKFCNTVEVIDIVVLSTNKFVVKYK